MTLPFQSLQFRELQHEWYEKLKSDGFQDIESSSPKSTKTFLKSWDSLYFKTESRFKGPDFFKIKADYYYYANQYLERGHFHTKIDREIWALHANGWGVRESAKSLNEKGISDRPFTRDKVWRTIKNLKLQMKAFLEKEREDKINKEEVLDYRPMKKEDENFIYPTWLKGVYSSTRWRNSPTWNDCQKYRNVIAHILSKPTTRVTVCCLKEDPDIIVGYAVFEKTPPDTILHWVFVRFGWQNKGIAKSLCPPSVTVVTHLTKIGERIWQKQKPQPRQILIPLTYEVLEATT